MQVLLPDRETRATLLIDSDRPMTDDEYFDFCAENRKLRIERTAQGEIIIMPPAGPESSNRNLDIGAQLAIWTKKDGRGKAFDSNTEFFLPNGAARSPDACWVPKTRLDQFTKEQKRRFLHLCPDFVIELMSPTDRLRKSQDKMQEWIDNGAQLAWLIDADLRTVYVYRPGQPPEKCVGLNAISGEGSVEGFTLQLADIWEGL
jgi:Uma2 family endonuclease